MTTFRASLASLSLAAMLAASTADGASALDVRVLDRDGRPVGNVAVHATPLEGGPQHGGQPAPTATIEQTDNAFVPHMLLIETGTEVTFPNNDTVSHHVYSFSDTKTFELALYKGNAHPPVRFDRPGIVVLGCNIHDGMLGYILVVDTPYFARTDGDGRASIAELPPGRYAVEAWTPRARPEELPKPKFVTVVPGKAGRLEVRLDGKLKPPHEHGGGSSLTWDRY